MSSADFSKKFSKIGSKIGKAFEKIPKLIDSAPKKANSQTIDEKILQDIKKRFKEAEKKLPGFEKFEDLSTSLGLSPADTAKLVQFFIFFCVLLSIISASIAIGTVIGTMIGIIICGVVLYLCFIIGTDSINDEKLEKQS